MAHFLRAMMIFSLVAASTAAMTDQKRDVMETFLGSLKLGHKSGNTTNSSVITGLVSIIVEVVKTSGALSAHQKEVISELKMQVETEEIPALIEEFTQDQNLLSYHANVVGDCDGDVTEGASAVRSLGRSAAQLRREHTACEAERQSILAEKYSASEQFQAWMNSLTPPDATAPSTEYGSEVEDWIFERLMFYESYNNTYATFVYNETKSDVEAKLSIANCTGELATYESTYCSWKAQIATVTAAYANCRNETTALYTSTLARVRLSEADRFDELRSLYTVKCQLEALSLDDSGISGELDACDAAAAADTTAIALSIPTLAAYDDTLVASLGSATADVSC